MFWKKKNKDKAEAVDAAAEAITANMKVVIRTDLGNVRTNNEDAGSFFKVAGENAMHSKGYLLLVADGMGGHNAGEVASKMAVEAIREEYFRNGSDSNREKSLQKAFETANKKIFEAASSNEGYRGMGTTCTAVVVAGQYLFYGHAGDSRAYLLKNNELHRLTEDHTYVQQLVKNGDITAAEAETHPQRNILTNAMGTKPSLRVDTGKSEFLFEQGNRLLLCSDGLYDYMTDAELAAALQKESLQEVADYLIAEAKRRGGKDNITVVLAERTETPAAGGIKLTRDADLPKLTRDAELPPGLNNNES